MAITIKEIATAAGVSKSLVSKVINGKPDVAPETREHVLQIIEQLEYVPNNRARNLSLGSNKDIAVILPSSNYVYMRFIFRLYEELRRYAYNANIYVTEHDKERERSIFQSIRANGLAGVACFIDPEGSEETCNWLEKLNVATVTLGEELCSKKFDRVFCSEKDMALETCRIVSERSAGTVHVLMLPESKAYERRRNHCIRTALQNCGLKAERVVFCQVSEVSAEEGLRVTRDILKLHSAGIICSLSNVLTAGCLRAMNESPHQMHEFDIVTLGDLSLLQDFGFSYPFVTFPSEAMARATADLLHHRISHADAPAKVKKLKPYCHNS